jgi:hypothetical protein
MVETTAQIETHIEDTRQHLGANLDALERKIKSAADWRAYFQSSPLTLLGVAFAGGVVLAMAVGAGHHRRGARAVRSVESPRRPRGPHAAEVVTMLDNIKGALVGLAAVRVKDLVGQVVPGFKEEFDRRQGAGSAAPTSAHAQTH